MQHFVKEYFVKYKFLDFFFMKKSTTFLREIPQLFQNKIHEFIHWSIMSWLIRLSKSSRGKDIIVDNNNFRYTNNGSKLESMDYWRCADR